MTARCRPAETLASPEKPPDREGCCRHGARDQNGGTNQLDPIPIRHKRNFQSAPCRNAILREISATRPCSLINRILLKKLPAGSKVDLPASAPRTVSPRLFPNSTRAVGFVLMAGRYTPSSHANNSRRESLKRLSSIFLGGDSFVCKNRVTQREPGIADGHNRSRSSERELAFSCQGLAFAEVCLAVFREGSWLDPPKLADDVFGACLERSRSHQPSKARYTDARAIPSLLGNLRRSHALSFELL